MCFVRSEFMKNKSLRFRINLWYTALMSVLSVLLLVFINIAGTTAQRASSQQSLIQSVERNLDEIEVENGILDIESDFSYSNDDIYISVFSDKNEIIGGAYPDGIKISAELQNGVMNTEKINGKNYYIYDILIEFNTYEYKINALTGEVFSSESEGESEVTAYKGNLDIIEDNCNITYKEAYELALSDSKIPVEKATLVAASFTLYDDIPLYEIEFHSEEKAHADIWVRGVMQAYGESNIWSVMNVLSILLLPMFVFITAFIGDKIAKKTMAPVERLSDTVSRIQSGDDLTSRIENNYGDKSLRALTDNFNNMILRLQKSFTAQRQFTSDASHELRTPVAVIMAESDYALSLDGLSDEVRESLESIKHQSKSMQNLISSLLSFTRMEGGLIELEFTKENLSELVICVSEDLKKIAKEKNITIHISVQENIQLNMDVALITRLLQNLILNAITYGNENGNVYVTLQRAEEKNVLTVADDGIGIEKEHLDKIFDRFYRVDKARSRENGNSGLGLSMVKQIVELHSGNVSVKSEKGKGSEFKVVI